MTLANYAEDRDGLLNMIGAGWDTITVQAPIEGAPDEVFAVMQGTLVVRLLFHQTETGQEHRFAITTIDEDGAEIGKIEGGMRVERNKGLPPGWDQNVNIVVALTGFPLPRPGRYTINVQVDGQFLGDRPFRVLKGY